MTGVRISQGSPRPEQGASGARPKRRRARFGSLRRRIPGPVLVVVGMVLVSAAVSVFSTSLGVVTALLVLGLAACYEWRARARTGLWQDN